jgi:hypothetical protein
MPSPYNTPLKINIAGSGTKNPVFFKKKDLFFKTGNQLLFFGKKAAFLTFVIGMNGGNL